MGKLLLASIAAPRSQPKLVWLGGKGKGVILSVLAQVLEQDEWLNWSQFVYQEV